MLRRINAAVFEAPAGATIDVVARAQNNEGINDARFEYAGVVLPRAVIQGLPGCSFTVDDASQRLQAVVGFTNGAAGTARYDLFEAENGVLSALSKFTLKADNSPLIDFVIDPVEAAVPGRAARRVARPGKKAVSARRAPAARARKKKRPGNTAKKSARGPRKLAAKTPRGRSVSRKRR